MWKCVFPYALAVHVHQKVPPPFQSCLLILTNLYYLSRPRPDTCHRPVLPALRPHKRLLLRSVVLGRKKANNRMHVLVSEKTAAHLPVADINPVRSIHSTLKRFLTEIFGADIPQHKVFIYSATQGGYLFRNTRSFFIPQHKVFIYSATQGLYLFCVFLQWNKRIKIKPGKGKYLR